eukprot:6459931-Amphidinium_carterae.1
MVTGSLPGDGLRVMTAVTKFEGQGHNFKSEGQTSQNVYVKHKESFFWFPSWRRHERHGASYIVLRLVQSVQGIIARARNARNDAHKTLVVGVQSLDRQLAFKGLSRLASLA